MALKVLELPKSFTVSRRRWLRGDLHDSSLHRKSDHKQCCLGFLAREAGCSLNAIKGLGTPSELKDIRLKKLVDVNGYDTPTCDKLIEVNDDPSFSDKIREKKLKSLFKRIGVKVNFVP